MKQAIPFNPPLRTGDYVSIAGTDEAPEWAVIDKATGRVITFANTRHWAREMADHTKGERIARVRHLTVQVAK